VSREREESLDEGVFEKGLEDLKPVAETNDHRLATRVQILIDGL
jgi:hypothetical protein